MHTRPTPILRSGWSKGKKSEDFREFLVKIPKKSSAHWRRPLIFPARSMSSLHQAVLNAFQKQGWACTEVAGMTVVESQFEAYHSKIALHLQSYEEPHILNVVGHVSLTAPNTHKSRAAELLMRVNRDLNLGNFELDWDRGAVMFRQSQIFSIQQPVDATIIVNLVLNTLAEVDRITPYLGTLFKTSPTLLPMLNLPDLLLREDLLPPVPVDAE